MFLQTQGQIMTFAVDPDITESATRANHQTNAIRLLGTMNTIGG